jgi:hypothetical protein
MSRTVFANYVIHDQIDLKYEGGSRIPGQTYEDVSVVLFHNNSLLPWGLSGNLVPSSLISSGTVYFYEITSSPGFYSLVFMPHLVGFFRLVLTYDGQEIIKEYDVLPDIASTNDTSISFG